MNGNTERYEEMVLRLDEAGRMAERARNLLADLDAAGNAADACQIGKAIALTYVAETALKEAESVIGRTTNKIWQQTESDVAKWWKAEELPKEYEGCDAWRWWPGQRTPERSFIPRDYDRRPSACGGLMLWPLPKPPIPHNDAK